MSNYFIKSVLAFGAFLCFGKTYSQVGIGTTNPDASSILEIQSGDSGLLIPRIALTDTDDVSTIASPATGLIIYNTAVASDVVAGFYFFDGTKWERLSTGSETYRSYAEVYRTSGSQNFNSGQSIKFGDESFAEGITIGSNGNYAEVSVAGVYRVSYDVTVYYNESGPVGSPFDFSLFIQIDSTPVEGSYSYGTLSEGETITLSKSKLIHVNEDERIYVYPSMSENDLKVQSEGILSGTSIIVELVDAD